MRSRPLRPRLPRARSGAPVALLAAATLLSTGCRPGDADIETGQAIVELGDAVNDLRQESSILQQQLDSMRIQLARQDTLLRQLANLAGVR